MVKNIYDYIEGKERKRYAKKYGCDSLINYFHGLPWNDEESERVYKICLDEGITWEKYYELKNKNDLIF